MAKIDRVKEFIGLLKALLITLIVIDTSLVAWLFNNTGLSMKSIIVIVSIICISLSIIILFSFILEKITSLEDI